MAINRITAQSLSDGTITAAKVAADMATQAELDTKLNLSGGTLTGDLILGDNVKLEVGSASGGDLQIYHDGTDSYISDAGAGNIKVITNGNGIYMQSSGGENLARFVNNGDCALYYDNSNKLATSSTGIDVTGSVTANTLVGGSSNFDIKQNTSDGSDNQRTRIGGGGDVVNSRGAFIELHGNEHTATGKAIINAGNITGGEISLRTGGSEKVVVDKDGNVGIGTSSPSWGIETGNFRGTASAPSFTGTGDGFAFDVYNEGNPYERHCSIAALGDGTSVSDLSLWTDSGSSVTERMRIDSSGNVGIGNTGPDVKLALHETAAIISSGVADRTSTMKGIKITTPQNGNESLGLWFGTGGAHWSGISGQRSSAATTWGTDLRFYTHQNGTSGLTTSTERMRIDSEGRVTTPAQPFFWGRLANSSTKTAGWNTSFGHYTTVVVNRGSHYNTSTGNFTCPVAGDYEIAVGGFISTASDGTRCGIEVQRNGVSVQILGSQLSDGDTPFPFLRCIINCSANDTLKAEHMYTPIAIASASGIYALTCQVRLLG